MCVQVFNMLIVASDIAVYYHEDGIMDYVTSMWVKILTNMASNIIYIILTVLKYLPYYLSTGLNG